MSDKTVAELMALADAMASEAHQSGLAEPGSRYSDITGPAREQKARASLEQAIRRAVDWGAIRAWEYSQAGGKPFVSINGPESFSPNELSENEVTVTPLYARQQEGQQHVE